MSRIPTDPLAAAAFLTRVLYRPVRLGHDTDLFALSETELPCQGDVWFWTDDNAKSLELLSRPEIWRTFPEQTEEILRFVRTMCQGPFIFRRVSVPRLEFAGRAEGIDSYTHALLHIRCDSSRGAVTAGTRFHDGRTADNVLLAGNTVEFTYRRRRFAIDVENTIVDHETLLDGGTLTIRHSSELQFATRWKSLRLGRITYIYTLDAAALPISVEVTLDIDSAIDVSDVVLTVGHDYVSHGINGVYYTRLAAEVPGSGTVEFTAGKPGPAFQPASGATYYGIIQPEVAGLALAVHTAPRTPERLIGFATSVKYPGFLHLVQARYRFDGPCRGARLVVAEDKVLTAGGFYERTTDYAAIVGRAVAARSVGGNPMDFSVSYDYGAEINAFAKCFAVVSAGEVTPRSPDLADELRGMVDRYIADFFDVFIAGHRQKKNTIISRQLAFVILGAVTMLRATKDDRYRKQMAELCDTLLDFELRYEDITGTPAGGFTYGIYTHRSAFVDGHSASLLALTQASRCIDDTRFAEAIDRGLASYCFETCRATPEHAVKIDTISTMTIDEAGKKQTQNAFWNFNIGMALRFFAALRKTADPALQAVLAKHAERMELLEMVMRRQIENSIIPHDDCVELAVAPHGGETNSETQPWVALGLFGHPYD